MLKIISTFVIFFQLNVYAGQINIISDLDDTLKITNVSDWNEAIQNALFNTDPFMGMPDLINQMSGYTDKFFIVTGSPSLLNKNIEKFLKVNELNPTEVIARNLIRDRDTKEFKIKVISKIIENNAGEFILLGDDTQEDQVIFKTILEKFPQRLKAIYIHQVKNEKPLTGFHGFYSALDIVKEEYKNGRMNLSEAYFLAKKFLLARDLSTAFPDFSYCPKTQEEFNQNYPLELKAYIRPIELKIESFCRRSSSL